MHVLHINWWPTNAYSNTVCRSRNGSGSSADEACAPLARKVPGNYSSIILSAGKVSEMYWQRIGRALAGVSCDRDRSIVTQLPSWHLAVGKVRACTHISCQLQSALSTKSSHIYISLLTHINICRQSRLGFHNLLFHNLLQLKIMFNISFSYFFCIVFSLLSLQVVVLFAFQYALILGVLIFISLHRSFN